MRHAPNSTSVSWHFNSPIPYLFGGLAAMLLLIAAALIILFCSNRKRPSSAAEDHVGEDEKAARAAATFASVDNTPKIVVIMAGDSKPTQLAIPVSDSKSAVS